MDSIVSSLYGAISKHIQELMILFKTAKDADTIPIITHFPEIMSCIKQLKSIKHDPTRYNELRQYCNEIINYILMDADEQPVEPIDENDYDILNFENKNIITNHVIPDSAYNLTYFKRAITYKPTDINAHLQIHLFANKKMVSEALTQIYLKHLTKIHPEYIDATLNYLHKSFISFPTGTIKNFLEFKYLINSNTHTNAPDLYVVSPYDTKIINLFNQLGIDLLKYTPETLIYVEKHLKQQYSFKFIKLMQNRFNKMFDMPIIREIPDAEKDKETLLKELSELKQKNKKYDTERTEEVCCICLTPKYTDDEIFVSTCGHVMHKKCFIKYHYVPAYSICRKAHPIK